MYILIQELSVFSPCFLRYIQSNLDKEYDPLGNSNFSFHFGANILN